MIVNGFNDIIFPYRIFYEVTGIPEDRFFITNNMGVNLGF